MPLSEEDVLYGSAYRVLFERVDPDSCTTKEYFDALSAYLSNVNLWAGIQDSKIAIAYRRAISDISKRASDCLENNERARQMLEAMKTLPLPPT